MVMITLYHRVIIISLYPICRTEKETQKYITDFWTLWEEARVG